MKNPSYNKSYPQTPASGIVHYYLTNYMSNQELIEDLVRLSSLRLQTICSASNDIASLDME